MDEAELDKVLLYLGKAVFAAQAFELNLGTTLIALTVAKGDRSKFRNEEDVRMWLDKVERLSIGQLKGELNSLGVLPAKMIADIEELNAMRIRVVHHFASHWVERLEQDNEQENAIAELKACAEAFRAAARRLQDGIEAARDV